MNEVRGWPRHLALLALGLGLIAAYVLFAEVDEVVTALRSLPFRVLATAGAITVAAWLPRVASFHLLDVRAGPSSWKGSLRACLGSNALNLVFPARLGDVGLVAALTVDRPVDRALSLVVHWRALSFLTLLVLAGSVVVAAAAPGPALWTWMVGSALVFLVFAAALFAWGSRHLHRAISAAVARLRRRLEARGALDADASHAEPIYFDRFGAILPPMSMAALAWVAEVAVAVLFLRAVEEVALALAIFAALLASAAKALRLTPGGIGVYEGVFAGFLFAAGLEPAPAVAAGALAAAFSNLVTLGLGAGPGASLLSAGTGRTAKAVARWRAERSAPKGEA